MASFSVLTAFWIIKTSQAKERSKEKQRENEENRGQQLQSSFTLLEHFPKSIFYMLYTISKLRKSRIQHFKPCTIWSWNEEDMAFGRQLLQACTKFAQHLKIRTQPLEFRTAAHAWCEISSIPPTPHEIFYFRYFCINFHSPCNQPTIRFLS